MEPPIQKRKLEKEARQTKICKGQELVYGKRRPEGKLAATASDSAFTARKRRVKFFKPFFAYFNIKYLLTSKIVRNIQQISIMQ
jgi:hypothetical protein